MIHLALLGVVALVAVLFVPLLLVGLVFKLAFGLLFLPFKVLGLALKLAFGALHVAGRAMFGLGALAFGLVALVLLPLLPFLFLGLIVWAVFRAVAGPTRAIVTT